MCASCGCNYTKYNHGNGTKVPMMPNGINPMPMPDGKIPASPAEKAVPRKPKK
jgi:hypothetical protein